MERFNSKMALLCTSYRSISRMSKESIGNLQITGWIENSDRNFKFSTSFWVFSLIVIEKSRNIVFSTVLFNKFE